MLNFFDRKITKYMYIKNFYKLIKIHILTLKTIELIYFFRNTKIN